MDELINYTEIFNRITQACPIYEKTAPTAYNWLNDLYIRIDEAPETVTLKELQLIEKLLENEEWINPNYLTNCIFKLLAPEDRKGLISY